MNNEALSVCWVAGKMGISPLEIGLRTKV